MKRLLPVILTLGCALAHAQTCAFTPAILPNATVGTTYSAILSAVCGGKSYYTYISGMPQGLNLSGSYGTIKGTPTQAGIYVLNVKLTGANGSVIQQVQIAVANPAPPPTPLSVSTQLIIPCGQPFSVIWNPTGGTPPYTRQISSGTIPQGTMFSPTTGVLSGATICAQVGTVYNFTVTVTDSGSPAQSVPNDDPIKVK